MNPGTKLAVSAAMRRSHAAASERPAPAVGPLTAAITGFSSARIARMFGWYVLSSRSRMSSATSRNSVRSWPAQKPRPAPVITTARTSGSAASTSACRQRGVQRGVERVEHLGAVQRDRQHRAVACRLGLGHQRPLNSGCRFSMNAFSPSLASSDANAR